MKTKNHILLHLDFSFNTLTLHLHSSLPSERRRCLPCCRTLAQWDNCSAHRSHPGSPSTHCLNSPSCSCTPSFLQCRSFGLFVLVQFFFIGIGKKRKTFISYFICMNISKTQFWLQFSVTGSAFLVKTPFR